MISLIDAHAHHQQEPLHAPVELIERAIAAGIVAIGLGGTHPEDWSAQAVLRTKFPKRLFTHYGLHPWWVEQYSREEIEKILLDLDHRISEADGLGETGLDFYTEKRDPARFDDQRFAFREQLRLAIRYRKPVVLHIVSAHEEALKILREENAGSAVPLIIHRFSGTVENARSYLGLGAYLSFHDSKKWMKEVPLSQLLLETDSNGRQHPGGWDIRPHYQKTAEIMGLEVGELAQKVAENFARIGYSRSI